jgi:hypothetical protein
METTNISASVLIESLKQMLAQELLGEKLGWWLRFGAATERWFQFEYGFWLDRCLGNEYAVGFEQHRVSGRFKRGHVGALQKQPGMMVDNR